MSIGLWFANPGGVSWDYNAMQDWNLNGTWATNTSTVLAQSAGYPVYVSAISKESFKGLASSWQLDWEFNKTGFNVSPFPGQAIAITQSSVVPAGVSGQTLGDKLVELYSGNGYSLNFNVRNSAGSAIHTHTVTSSAYAQAGYPHRITYDQVAGVFKWWSSTSTSVDDLVLHKTATLTGAQYDDVTTAAALDRDYYIGVAGRGGTDGVRNVEWIST